MIRRAVQRPEIRIKKKLSCDILLSVLKNVAATDRRLRGWHTALRGGGSLAKSCSNPGR